jgi:hypothetical protein
VLLQFLQRANAAPHLEQAAEASIELALHFAHPIFSPVLFGSQDFYAFAQSLHIKIQ